LFIFVCLRLFLNDSFRGLG